MSGLNSFFSSPYLGLGLGAVSTGISTAAAYRDAQAQNAANELNAQTYQQNAELSRLQAGVSRKFGEQEYTDTIREYRNLQGQQRAGYGASGVSVSTGSAAEVVANTAAEGVYEAQKTKYSRDLAAWQLEQEAAGYDFEATKLRNSYANPYLSASTAAIGGLTSMYSTYGKWQRNPTSISG